MKDLDFDELDRAVSSLLGAEDTESAGGDKNTDDTVEISNAVQEPIEDVIADVPSDDHTGDEDSSNPVEQKPIVARRPTGRFMDVMHSSSDMKSRPKPANVSHNAVGIAPLGEDTEKTDTTVDVTPVTPVASEETTPVDTTDDNQDQAEPTFPDPLDFHNFSPEESEDTTTDHDAALDDMASELSGLDGLIVTDQELVSVDTPFIDGSTIEKRPLGAFSVNTEGTDASLPSVEDAVVEGDADTEVTTDDAASESVDSPISDPLVEHDTQILADADIIPEELKGDIVAIEASSVEPIETPPAGGSIQQQYAEKTQPVTSEPTPVFDTTQYHQPLKHAPKQKSGWVGVFLIILLIAIGIGGGVALYSLDPLGLK